MINSGTITAGAGGSGIIANGANASPSFGHATVTNSGTIIGGSYGIVANTAIVTNSGTISGATGIYAGGGSFSMLVNSGIIAGTDGTAIDFSGSHSDSLTFLAGSRISGLIDLGTGDTVNFGGGSWNYTFGGPNGPGDATINTGGAPFVVSGNQVAVVDPTGFATADRTTVEFTRAISGLVSGHTEEVGAAGGGNSWFSPLAFGPPDQFSGSAFGVFDEIPALSYAKADTMVFKNPTMTTPDGHSVWASGFYGQRIQQADGPVLRNVTSFYGGAIGIDGLLRPDFRLGALVGGGNTSTAIDLNSGNAGSDIVFGGAYGRYRMGSAFLDFALLGGSTRNTTTRNINNNLVPGGNETAAASFGGWFVSPEIAYGYRYTLPGDLSVTPAARLRYVAAGFDGFTESGSTANLTIRARTLQDIEERGDLTLARIIPTGWGPFTVNLHGGVLGLQRVGDNSVNAILLGQVLAFATPGKSSIGGAYAGGGLEWRPTRHAAIFASSEYTSMSDSSSTVTAKGGLRIGF